MDHDCPLLIAGDLFDRWNCPHEAVNMLMSELPPRVYAVPGNHDLPYHSWKERHKSAFWTMVMAGKIIPIEPNAPSYVIDTIRLHGFPHGFEVEPPKDKGLCLDVAVIHDYIWQQQGNHNPEDKSLACWRERLNGYDVAIFGDNHQGFLSEHEKRCTICNCGAAIRRKADEFNYRPSVGLLYDNGEMDQHYLDTSRDKWVDRNDLERLEKASKVMGIDADDFLQELANLSDAAADFRGAIMQFVDNLDPSPLVRRLVVEAMEGKP